MTEVDVGRKRIGLTMRKDGGASASEDRDEARKEPHTPRGKAPEKSGKPPHGSGKKDDTAQRGNQPGALGSALLDAMKKR